MLNPGERANGLCDLVRARTGKACRNDGRKNVFEVVCTRKRNLGLLQNDFLFAMMAEDNLFAAKESSLRNALLAAEPKNLGFSRSVRSAGRIVGVENCEVRCGLVFEDARLDGAVGFHRAMPIEMVGRK